MGRTLISVIIPSYNRANTVGNTIDSIVAQQVDADIEIIVGDDCSTDNAREVLTSYREKYPDIIRLFFREKNVGLGANWALCVKECRGEFVCNCDNDDYWHNPRKLQIQLDYMMEHPECNIVITDHRTHNRMTGEIKECKAWIDHSMSQQQAFFTGRNSICNATIMYRKSIMEQHLNLDDYIKYKFTLQDWNTWMILTAYTDIQIIPVSTATFGIETVSITRPKTYEQICKRYDKELECYKYCIAVSPNPLHFDEPGWYQYVNHQLVRVAYQRNEYSKAREFSKSSVNGMMEKMVATPVTFWLYRLFKVFRGKL